MIKQDVFWGKLQKKGSKQGPRHLILIKSVTLSEIKLWRDDAETKPRLQEDRVQRELSSQLARPWTWQQMVLAHRVRRQLFTWAQVGLRLSPTAHRGNHTVTQTHWQTPDSSLPVGFTQFLTNYNWGYFFFLSLSLLKAHIYSVKICLNPGRTEKYNFLKSCFYLSVFIYRRYFFGEIFDLIAEWSYRNNNFSIELFCYYYFTRDLFWKCKCFCGLHSPLQEDMNRQEDRSPANAPLIPFAARDLPEQAMKSSQ